MSSSLVTVFELMVQTLRGALLDGSQQHCAQDSGHSRDPSMTHLDEFMHTEVSADGPIAVPLMVLARGEQSIDPVSCLRTCLRDGSVRIELSTSTVDVGTAGSGRSTCTM